ncbi:hypothetical protein P879_11236 [Paragonimus westermani]|uniref:Mitochondrial import inner membrane translocase subunit n=1 Tax=Paragonimus westermani TaxID=34504 RepID=A0A8T0DAA4_9TREM|nr:hypothetical protein P879_11236 [Paragonimus westermani]
MDASPNGLNLSSLTTAQKEQLMEQMKAEVALVSAQELLQKMSDKCFEKCVTKPGTTLDSSEQKCVGLCMDRYVDAWNLVSRTFASRIRRETEKL